MNNNNIQYSGIKVEYSVLPLSSKTYIAPYNQYIFGDLTNENKSMAIYRIRKDDQTDKFMRFEFSSNEEKEKIEVAFLKDPPKEDSKDLKSDIKVEDPVKSFGKNIYIVTLETKENKEINEFYFVVFSKEKASNFVFKYYSAETKQQFPKYEFDQKITKNINSNTSVTLNFQPIKKKTEGDSGIVQATFIAIVVDKKNNPEKFNSICFNTENVYKIYKKEYYNIRDNNIKMKLDNFPNDKHYDVIVSAITNEDYSEIFYYNIVVNPLDYSTPLTPGTKIAIILLIVFIVVLICIFGFIFYKMRMENKDLNDRINRMSGYNVVSDDPENLNYHKQD